jgi:DNA-binding HxlR family transcriptional regulator
MEKLGLIEKRVLTEPYRPVVYYLTEKGKKLTEIIEQLQELQ